MLSNSEEEGHDLVRINEADETDNITGQKRNPNAVLVTEECTCCDGNGRDWTSEYDYELCEACEGKGKVTTERDYLAEAFRIAQDRWYKPIQKEHVTAVIKHCRSMVGALMELPEVA